MTVLELVWTITPALVLIAIAFPSFRLLYIMDEVISPTLTIKVVGHQWYWSYSLNTLIINYKLNLNNTNDNLLKPFDIKEFNLNTPRKKPF